MDTEVETVGGADELDVATVGVEVLTTDVGLLEVVTEDTGAEELETDDDVVDVVEVEWELVSRIAPIPAIIMTTTITTTTIARPTAANL